MSRRRTRPHTEPARWAHAGRGASLLFALVQLGCGGSEVARGERSSTPASMGAERAPNPSPETTASSDDTSDGSGETTASSEATASNEASSEATTAPSETALAGSAGSTRAGSGPAARAPGAEARGAVTIRVHTSSGPISRAVAEHALSRQHARLAQCFLTAAGPDATGSIRGSIHVEASGAARVELETMSPELDRALRCVDTTLERSPFPASHDGRPTHIVAEIARTP